MNVLIRNAEIVDLDEISNIELECFGDGEAAKRKQFKERIEAFKNSFL